MSGHSKWSSIKRQKGVADVKRGVTFTKMAMAISIAAREGGGGDPDSNFRLRLAVDQARAVNMPKENIQRAIDRGLGKGTEGSLDSTLYEGYGPGKVAIIVEAATDNKNRTTAEVKNIIEKSGGSFVNPGTVSWMFQDWGVIVLPKAGKTMDEFLDLAIEAGAEDVEDGGDVVDVYTKPNTLDSVRKVLLEKGLVPQSAELTKKATTLVEIGDLDMANRVMALLSKLEDLDDVQKVHSNFEIAEGVMV